MQSGTYIKIVLLTLLIPFIQACPSSPSGGSVETTLDVTVTLPATLTSAVAGSVLSAADVNIYVNKVGDARVEMTYSGGNSASYSYTSLSNSISSSPATYEVTIEYGVAAIVIGTANNDVTISAGSNTLVFADSLFDLTIDTDSDSKDNLAELIAGSDPLIPTCVLGTGLLGNCELES